MSKGIWTLGLSLILIGAYAFAQQKADPPRATTAENMATKEHCEQLLQQFNAADVTKVEARKLTEAKHDATRGSDLCGTDPREGVRVLDRALKDIGATPK